MANPFQYGSVVAGPAFCNRRQELADLTSAMESSARLFLYSERRLGKTSLVKRALHGLPKNQFTWTYVDLSPTDGEASFVTTTARAITESMSSTAAQLLEMATQFFSRLAPSVSPDAEGKPKITFGPGAGALPEPDLEEALAAPARIAARSKRKVVVVFDEVQQILDYGSDLVERRLRSVIQQQHNVCYLFLGSQKHLIQRMFLDKSRPLFRAAGHYPIGPIETRHWLPFIGKKFRDGGRPITDAAIEAICKLTEGHPFYTQHLCHALWEMAEPRAPVTDALIRKAVQILLDRESYAYSGLWESLTISQKRALKGLASEPRGTRPFAGEFVRRYGLSSASTAQRALDKLLSRDLIDRDSGSFLITDRFFRLWIAQRQVQ